MFGSLFSSKKSSSSSSSTTNNDNRQVYDASGGGDIVTGGIDRSNSESFAINGTGNSVSFIMGDAQARAAAGMEDKTTTGHEVTAAGKAQAAGVLATEGGKWGVVAVVALLALAWKAAR